MIDPPCTAAEAVRRAQSIAYNGGEYRLGTGDYSPMMGRDNPWTWRDRNYGSDCAGFAICWAWKLHRHRPGFNIGPWATVSDDINCNSAIEDGLHKGELFLTMAPGTRPVPGDLITYPTIYLRGHEFVGHVGLVEFVPADYKAGEGWHRLQILQCHGPNGFKPGVVRTDGSIWDHHDAVWPLPAHRTQLVRPRERV